MLEDKCDSNLLDAASIIVSLLSEQRTTAFAADSVTPPRYRTPFEVFQFQSSDPHWGVSKVP